MGSDPEGNNTPMGLTSLGGYFDNLAAAVANEKSVLEDLVKKLTTLNTRNADMADTTKKITGDN